MTIKELRSRTGLTQVKFAEKFHIGLPALRSWEQGWSRPQSGVLFMIERILDLEDELGGR
ncbi:MAG: helix-turn-helix domain-containing protein [Clostridia bacterium]|nr:helix-turn-helix domain-containing protein [Clostridia bacterium]